MSIKCTRHRQFLLALCACTSKVAAAMPGATASVSRLIREIDHAPSRCSKWTFAVVWGE
jgi:hypothetical protein